MNDSFGQLQILEKPHWESADKSWAVFLGLDEDQKEKGSDFTIRVVDHNTGGSKTAHMGDDEDGTPKLVWPRMGTLPKDVKVAVDVMLKQV